MRTLKKFGFALAAAIGLVSAPAQAQELETFDPDRAYAIDGASSDQPDTGAIDADLANPGTQPRTPVPVDDARDTQVVTSTQPGFDDEFSDLASNPAVSATATEPDADWALSTGPTGPDAPATGEATTNSATYGEDDLIGAAEGVFGKGAKGLAKLIEDLLREQGEPNGYIVGREAGGAFVVGARYGSGTLHHKIEGQRKVYWTGPSIGFDAGANAANSFVLVYNLYDSEDLYKRFPAGEGQAYLVGGLHVSYMRRGDIVLIPIRVGAGLRLGVNAGYMKFSKKQRWLPF